MKHLKYGLAWIIFLISLAGIFYALHLFLVVDESITYISWDEAVQILPDGTESPISTHESLYPANGSQFRLRGVLPENLPEGDLVFEPNGLKVSLYLNGKILWASDFVNDAGQMPQATIPLSENTSGSLTLNCTILATEGVLFPPLLRFFPADMEVAQTTALANREAFTSGAAALAFILVLGIFLLRLQLQKPDWSLIFLLLATLGLIFYRLIQSQGYYFVSQDVYLFFCHQEIGLVILGLLVGYLLLHRQRRFWKQLGIISVLSVTSLLLMYLYSGIQNGNLACWINEMAENLANGRYDGFVYAFTYWLTLSGTLCSADELAMHFMQQKIQEQGLLMENRRVHDHYRQLEAWSAETSKRAHEINHQLTVLDCLLQEGQYEDMQRVLENMKISQKRHQSTRFTAHHLLNMILQNTAAIAKQDGIGFEADIQVPQKLNIPDDDLSTLLLNMLDNALEATRQCSASTERIIRIQIHLNDLYLAIKCQNPYHHELKTNAHGHLKTTKVPAFGHGFGWMNMQKIAQKYQSALIYHTYQNHLFILETALRVPTEKTTD